MNKDLGEIRQKIEDYNDFLDSLEEISNALETSTGLGLFLQYESEEALQNTNALKMINDHDALKRIRRHYYRYADPVIKDYINVLLVIWAKTNAKIGEIAFLLENSVEELEDEEAEILDRMEQEQIADSDYCQMSDLDCDDCYISECSSSACER